jgi:arylformamidase
MSQTVDINGLVYRIGPGDGVDISIPLRFNGTQPNAFGVEAARSSACEYGTLVGDTRRGGSCNFEQITLIPHCNGTHTECVGHITDERISVRDCLSDVFIPAVLISMESRQTETGDAGLTHDELERALTRASKLLVASEALIVRTLPSDETKLSRIYDQDNIPPYFTPQAMERIVGLGIKHLLVDLPSIDRLLDDGKLVNHRLFWNVPPGGRGVSDETRKRSTITELIYVPGSTPDGQYLLNLQIAPFEADAAPSRPILFPLERVRKRHDGEAIPVSRSGTGAGGGSGRGTGSAGSTTGSRARERSGSPGT